MYSGKFIQEKHFKATLPLYKDIKSLGLFKNGNVTESHPIKARYGHYYQRSQNTLSCVYNKSQFLSNATMKSWSFNIILELGDSYTRITKSFELFVGGTITKIQPIKAKYGHYYQRSQNTLSCVYKKSQFLSNATMKSWSNQIILELGVSYTMIRKRFALFIGGTITKLQPIKAHYRQNCRAVLKHIIMTVFYSGKFIQEKLFKATLPFY